MTYLSLFSGVGGGDLGMQHLLGWECKGYVEWDEYCCRVLEQRIREGHLSPAPVWQMDIREFNERVAGRYRGVDCITGGFPCQPFSVAGKGLAENDPRNQWPATIECIRLVGPRVAYMENVPGLICKPYWGTILGDLAEAGYDARWIVLGADDCGAPHRRKRLWVLANNQIERCGSRWPESAGFGGGAESDRSGDPEIHATDSNCERGPLQTQGKQPAVEVARSVGTQRMWPSPQAADANRRGGGLREVQQSK